MYSHDNDQDNIVIVNYCHNDDDDHKHDAVDDGDSDGCGYDDSADEYDDADTDECDDSHELL